MGILPVNCMNKAGMFYLASGSAVKINTCKKGKAGTSYLTKNVPALFHYISK